MKKILEFLGGDFVKTGLEFVNKRWPPKMSEEDRAQAELAVSDMLHNHKVQLEKMEQENQAEFNKRLAEYEGTAKDLTAVPFVGSIVIFGRGAFRPVFAFSVLYWDHLYFYTIREWTERQEVLLLTVNILVLGFFFGERTLRNLLPLLERVFLSRAAAPVPEPTK